MMMAPSRLHSPGFAKSGPTTHKKLIEKYSNLSNHFHVFAVGVETYGVYGLQSIKLVKQIGKTI